MSENIKIPARIKERFKALEKVEDLVDGCKYILILEDGWEFQEGGMHLPVRSKTEAIEFLRYDAVKMSQ